MRRHHQGATGNERNTSFIVCARNATRNQKGLVRKPSKHIKKIKLVMHLQDHAIEAKLKPVQELKRSDALRLWVGQLEFFSDMKKDLRNNS